MGKRSEFERKERDFYQTPPEAVVPLLRHLGDRSVRFAEPCCGDGSLIDVLVASGNVCVYAADIEPRGNYTEIADATQFPFGRNSGIDLIISNPPWSRDVMHKIIQSAINSGIASWFLIDADWMHTKQSAELMKHCRKIVSVGRVKWIPDSKSFGKDNCCWYLFTDETDKPALFYGR